MQLGSVLQL